jgi:predicted lactoylglutathione lyase
MKIPRMTVVTLGVADLTHATQFYEYVLATPPNTENTGVTFFELPGTWISLFPLSELAKDIAPDVVISSGGFNGVTLAYNARSKQDVVSVIKRAQSAGALVHRPPHDTFWGGYSGYFADLDGHYWEVAWGPMFDFSENGELRLKPSATH